MQEIIKQKIREIETGEDVTVLHAVESGSRAWGFASPDSDYDVRFIYLRPLSYYLKLEKTRDVIEWQLDETLDINGWDLAKMFRLLHNSNPTIFEWNNSPIVYKTTDAWAEIHAVIDSYFLSKSGVCHYLSAAKSNYQAYFKGDTAKLKKYFYVLRPMLACKWILNRQCPPPMLFSDLVDAELEDELKPVVAELVEQKMRTPEVGVGERIPVIDSYIEKNLETIMQAADTLPSEGNRSWAELDDLFVKLVVGESA